VILGLVIDEALGLVILAAVAGAIGAADHGCSLSYVTIGFALGKTSFLGTARSSCAAGRHKSADRRPEQLADSGRRRHRKRAP